MAETSKPVINIRELEGVEDFKKVQRLEREAWGLADIDVLALTTAVATREAGALWLGAFDDISLAGFAFAFPGLANGDLVFHSHMLAVQAKYRDTDVGYNLKLAQRKRALAIKLGDSNIRSGVVNQARISEITWTFDPLQSKNAHLNFSKLGVLSDSYKIDLYGAETSSSLHRNGTDRLWVRWPIASRRVQARIEKTEKKDGRTETLDALSTVRPLVMFSGQGIPKRSDLDTAVARQRIAIEIPSDIGSIEKQDPELAREWRLATRWGFIESLKSGFFVSEFCRNVRGQQGPGTYLLEKGKLEDYV